jgi:quercetin dioxygenase-like cupin family protein
MIREKFAGKQFCRIALNINTSHLLEEIEDNADLFELETFRQDFEGSPFKATKTIPCRMTYENYGELTMAEYVEKLKTNGITSTEAIELQYYEFLPRVYEAVMTLAHVVRAERIGRVLVTKLMAGGRIGAHSDLGEYHQYYDRFHIVVSGKGCEFRCGQEWVTMLPGEIWWFNNIDEHEVHNNTDVDRIHIIVDFKLRGNKLKSNSHVIN